MKDFFKVILWLALLGHPTIARSQSPDPNILTIEQATGKTATYTEKQLRSGFDLHERTTATPWSKKGQKTIFRGPLLKDILARSHLADVKEFEVVAYNDFIARVTSKEIDAFSPMVAIEQQCAEEDRASGLCKDGQLYRPLSIDDGGPFYLVWPLDDLPSSYILSRKSIWVWFVVNVRPSR
ncbi:hypothetical protein FHS21_001397 [Phyllobacterium trifolii]|jgi:hypothetical protein|uniref:Oxidoreductase molybdopterin-binding domain-containing protein n=1 Tax=Phyllobacterium trifolii TaxID=300193 RepID=A0A839U1Z5_9HYPH|nr:hypothetical protein [Phyllobacterium trifolii]MBB3144996.1 hypothetical protein [Phyllobacterium trifolii]